MLQFFCSSFVVLTLSGCIGLVINTPAVCENETPHPDVHEIMMTSQATPLTPPFLIRDPRTSFTKADFREVWGEPDEIITTSENIETWVYKRKLWCGWIPFLIIPVPLILPVCDGYDKIDFQDDIATRLNTRHIVSNGGIFILFYPLGPRGITGGAGTEPACMYPLSPNNDVDSDEAKPVMQGTP